MNGHAMRTTDPGPVDHGPPGTQAAAASLADRAGRRARIGRYLLSTLETENDFLARALRDVPPPPPPQLPPPSPPPLAADIAIRNLRDRPHVVRLIESRAGGVILGALQVTLQALWFPVRHWRRVRAASLRPETSRDVAQPPLLDTPIPEAPIPEAPIEALEAPGPKLSEVDFDPAILDRRPRILIDITPTARNPGAAYGIARVARELARAAVLTGVALPVRMRDGALYSYFEHPLLQGPLAFDETTTFVIVDVFWHSNDAYRDMVRRVRARGTRVALVVHDIYPSEYPSLFPREVPPLFEAGLRWLLARSGHCLSLSRHGMREVREHLRGIGEPWVERLRHDHFSLGATMHETDGPVRELVSDLFASGRVFLAVGTVEPRKGYSVTLDACDIAWARGETFALVIIGAPGWRSMGLQDRIRRHPGFGRALYWIEDATDAELGWAYARCRALIQSSVAEGFGLPVAEALRHGAPVIASDLEVFGEIGGTSVTTYRVGDAGDLAARMLDSLAGERRPIDIRPGDIRPGDIRPGDTRPGDWCASVRSLAACLTEPEAEPPLRNTAPARPRSTSGPSRIHVACCFDNGLAMQAGVVAASVASATTDAPVTFHMLHAPNLDIRIADLAAALDSPTFTIAGHEIGHDFSAMHATSQYPEATYYRFLIPDMIQADRVVYLDCDTLVRRSLVDLFDVDLHGHPIAAAPDYALTHHMRNHDFNIHNRGMSYSVDDYALDVLDLDLTRRDYFNSGIMVMDLGAWRRAGLAARLMETCRTGGVFAMADQDVMNRGLKGDFEPIDTRWNAMTYLYREYIPEPGAQRPVIFGGGEANMRAPTGLWRDVLSAWAFDPWIVHFTYRSKPWVAADRRTDYDDEFWRNARKTPYGRILRDRFG